MDTGIILDLETTGLDYKTDKIIEIGIVEFVICDSTPYITNMYSGLEDPQEEISETISEVTHIKNEFLKDQKISWDIVRSFLSRSSIVIAHNAEFDSRFLAKREELKGIKLHWACSLNHIDWFHHGFKTRALNYLAADMQFINPFAHRALFDCATTFKVISPYLQELIGSSYEDRCLVGISQTPYELSQKLRELNYKWDRGSKGWTKIVAKKFLDSELSNLEEIKQENPHIIIDSKKIPSLDEVYESIQNEYLS